MSLKSFHIVFISLSAILMFGFSAWSFRSYMIGGGSELLVMAIFAAIGGPVLIIYGMRFLRKLKHVSYL